MISIGNLQINKIYLGDVEVTKAYLGDVKVYGSTPQPVGKYMTITVDDSPAFTTISPNVVGDIHPNLQYRINNGEWSDFIFGTTADIHLLAGDFVQFKGVNVNGISRSTTDYLNFYISGSYVTLSGNVMSLIDGVGDSTVIPNEYCFYNLFYQSYSIKTVSSDFLPATTLKDYCYRDMFNRCTSLATAPELPATTLAFYCYAYMFSLCKSLTTAPVLPATTLAYSCYSNMFAECTSLATAPELPATTLAFYCYSNMFYKCTSLTTAPVLPATTLAGGCYRDMFKGCTSLTTAPELPATTLADYCYQRMFNGCTSLTTAQELPATTLAEGCYMEMFNGCTSLTTAPVLPATTLEIRCYDSMFNGCTALTTAPVLPANTLEIRCYESMFNGCTALTTAPELPATTLKNDCYRGMFSGCTSLVKAPELPATTLAYSCYSNMFSGCTSLVKAPELPATTLEPYCYQSMFQICKSLNYIKSLATDITATNALKDWLAGVAATGTFVKPAGVGYPTGSSGIPSGWSVVEEKPKPEGKYMTMTVLDGAEGTVISPTVTGSLQNLNLQYRINSNGDWTDFIVGTTADIQVVSGDWIQFKGNNTSGISVDYNNYLNFAVSGNPVALSGNVMSLIDGVGETLVIPNKDCFCFLFENSNVKTVSKDFLPATTLKNNCYERMFWKCTSLTTVPELPATTLADSCYIFMFFGCTSLTTAPELPATTLEPYCYQSLFSGCSNLNYIKCLATSGTIKNGSVPMELYNWVSGVSPTGTFVKPAGVEYVLNSKGGIPQGWTIQNI